MPPKVEIKGKTKKPTPAKASNPAEAFMTGQIPVPQNSTKEDETKPSTNANEQTTNSKAEKNTPQRNETKIDKPRRGRPPKKTETKKQYSISIKPSLYEKAKKKAEERETSVNEIISEALSKYLK
ncbi:ribbon-helix-helix domain-containing protein [Pseudobutyrivibrio sp.]|uniref:ribbon-helix-helix domain-containing protein n=1 Tax=Pseudobutyrivibrio sp. TaxID=2014367 RepID=UPI001B55E33B|nr:ribbon-helix-helix domain-containing protein [Pseudobutyrivibrio sp.]MBP3261513.1 CopG family transcriptional regulator [Pseudobutyrivibrio sp.]